MSLAVCGRARATQMSRVNVELGDLGATAKAIRSRMVVDGGVAPLQRIGKGGKGEKFHDDGATRTTLAVHRLFLFWLGASGGPGSLNVRFEIPGSHPRLVLTTAPINSRVFHVPLLTVPATSSSLLVHVELRIPRVRLCFVLVVCIRPCAWPRGSPLFLSRRCRGG